MPATLFIFAKGRILRDSEDTVASLAREAQEIIAAGPLAATMKDRVKLRVGLVELLKDAEDLLDIDEASATYVLLETMRTALEGYYKIQRWWPVKPKYQLRDLQEHQPEMAAIARSVLNPAYTLDERFQAVSHLVDKVLEPVGGRLESWSSPVVRLDDPGHEAARQPAEVKSPPQTTV